MKKYALFLTITLSATLMAHGQITKEEKGSRGYLRLGLSNFGQELKDDLSNFSVNEGGSINTEASLLSNALEGRYGAERGYVFEFGRNYYFHRNSLLPILDARLGLDWTQLSLTYNKLNFDEMASVDEAAGYEVDATSFFAVSASSKLGPVFSISPLPKLVIDARLQLAATYHFSSVDYYAYDEARDDEKYFSFFPEDEGEEEGFSAMTKAGNFGFKTNYGATLRYGGLGVALDYFPGKIKSSYQSNEGHGEAKFKNNMFQIKLSLTL
ncbi:MAG TPA: hypothetical protein VNQ80_10785 [Parapedobacter sp.]|uniref:hypothetical protein n=1 Tax=Parapedobacter sp. TaxID=1958893 RepID=UPI002BA7DD35|nr:hypothetical protein [Parapedobacter sp.]HWK57818.1 hypothetical protein [Parapedobacter sp.]